jgi:hypothetical protein
MGRQPGFDHPPVYPVPESLESVGAAYQLLADRHEDRGDRALATVYRRAARAHWQTAQTMRAEAQRNA